MKNAELKELSTSDLKERLDTERANYTRMTLNHAITPLENPQQIKESRRNIARMLTELRARELAQ